MTANPDVVPLLRRMAMLPRAAWVICVGMFINKLGNFLNVFLVLYLTSEGHSAFLAGVALGAAGLGGFVGNVVGGSMADRFGRRSAMAVSMFGAALFTVLLPASPNVTLTIALAVLVGFFAQLYRPAAGAVLVDAVPAAQRLTAFALLRLAINLGMAIGPAIGGVLSALSYWYLFAGDAIACVLFGVLVLVMLPEVKPEPATPAADAPTAKAGYRAVFADRALRLYVLSMIAATFVYVQTTTTLPLHVKDAHLSNSFYGLLLGLNALLCILFELPMTKLIERRSARHVIAFGILVTGIGVAGTGLSTTELTLILTVVVWTFGEMIYTSVATTYPGTLAPAHLRGRYQGAEGMAVSIAQTAGPAAGGLFYALTPAGHWTACVAVSIVAAVLILGARARPAAPAEVTRSPAL